MTRYRVIIGDVLLVALPEQLPRGHEQSGLRPALVLGLPDKLGTPRFPMLIAAPLTTQIGKWAIDNPNLYPILPSGTAGLHQSSVILLDHLRAVDKTRIKGYIGSLPPEVYTPIEDELSRMFMRK